MKAVPIALMIAVLASAHAFAAETKSPLFGSAAAHLTTGAQNKATVGKGAYADYWGYYGNYYSYEAGLYGYYAYGSSDSTDNYYAAYQYATAATTAYSNAYQYAYYGY